jgi:hypothetical protein
VDPAVATQIEDIIKKVVDGTIVVVKDSSEVKTE